MKKTLILISLISVAILTIPVAVMMKMNRLKQVIQTSLLVIGKFLNYIFIENQNGAQIGSVNPECSGKNLYQFKQNK